MFGRKDNPFISRMTGYMNDALGGSYRHVPCAEEIVPMIETFFKKSMNANVNWDGAGVCWHIENITEIVKYLAMNTRNYEKLSNEDVASLGKIFEELNALHAEVLNHNSQPKNKDYLKSKISCISEMVCKNMVSMHDSEDEHEQYRDGMIFQSYEDLWKIIHRVNTEWDELNSRGFSLRVFYDYWETFKYDRSVGQEKTEEEKLKTFMALLDGKMKFVPVYEHRPVCFKVVDNDFEGDIVNTFENRYSKSYRMRQDGEEAQSVVSEE